MSKMRITDIEIGKRYRRDLGNISGLAESMSAVGLLHPVVVLKDRTLVAGARRIAAAKHLGWTEIPVTVASNLIEAATIIRAQGDENVQREIWEPSAAREWQLAMLPAATAAAKARQAEGGSAGGKQAGKGRPKDKDDRHGGNSAKPKRNPKAAEDAAAATGYDEKTLRMAGYVSDVAKQQPGLFAEIAAKMNTRRRDGSGAFQLAVSAAYKRVKSIEDREKARKAADEVASSPADGACAISACSMQELLSSVRDIDAIITDPPYPEKFLQLYEDLARLAPKALKSNGILAVMCGQSYLPRILADMSKHIEYRWMMAYLTPGGQAVYLHERKINTFWKPILLFGGKRDSIGDVVKSDVNDNDKRFHGWGQSESGMANLVERLTKPGDLVCDPFLGAGTTAVVALTRGRRFVGCDIDADSVKTAQGRVAIALRDMRKAA